MYWLSAKSVSPAPSFNGSGIAFNMTFEIVNQPSSGEPDAIVNIGFTYSLLNDTNGNPIEHGVSNATVVIHAGAKLPLIKVTPEHVEGIPECNNFALDIYLMNEDHGDLDPFWDVAGFDMVLNFDPTLLEALDVTVDPDGWFESFWPNGILVVKAEIDNVEGEIWVAFLGIPGDYGNHTAPYGQGRLFTVTFHAISESTTYPPESSVIGLDPVTVAGFPHPERDYPPWNGSDSSPPLPHVIENATYTPFYAGLPYEYKVDIDIEVGTIHFPGEIAEFYIQTSYAGQPINATSLNATLYYNGLPYDDLTPLIEFIDTGFYRIPYTIPGDATAGEYVLRVQAQSFRFYGIAIEGFQISLTLSKWNALLIDINGTLARVETDLGMIQLNLTAINATLSDLIIDSKGEILAQITTSTGTILAELDALNLTIIDIQDAVVTINSALGTITTKLNNINATIIDLIKGDNGVLAKIDTALGTVVAKLDSLNSTVTNIDTNVLDVQTSVGDVRDSMGALQSTATYGLIAACIFSLIAAIAAILLLIKKR